MPKDREVQLLKSENDQLREQIISVGIDYAHEDDVVRAGGFTWFFRFSSWLLKNNCGGCWKNGLERIETWRTFKGRSFFWKNIWRGQNSYQPVPYCMLNVLMCIAGSTRLKTWNWATQWRDPTFAAWSGSGGHEKVEELEIIKLICFRVRRFAKPPNSQHVTRSVVWSILCGRQRCCFSLVCHSRGYASIPQHIILLYIIQLY